MSIVFMSYVYCLYVLCLVSYVLCLKYETGTPVP